MIVADVSVVPIGEGTSVGRFVRRAVEALEASGLRVMRGPMSTSVEARTLDELFAAVRMAHEAVVGAGARRVLTTIKIDERLDREHTMASKLEAIR
ncbi:MAG: MTH1187 family thiamine-binding protein [Thermoplasmatota archaeon]